MLRPRPYQSARALAHRRVRRGGVYVVVLGIATLLTVAGMGVMLSTRAELTAATRDEEWKEAGDLAFSATELAISTINSRGTASPTGWRSLYTSGQVAFTGTLGRGTIRWVLVDEDDGDLANDYSQRIRLYGIGKVGSTTRTYSVLLKPSGTGLPILGKTVHSGDDLAIGGTVATVSGAVSANDAVVIGGTLLGSAEGATLANFGTITGGSFATTAAKQMPGGWVFDEYSARATALPGTALGSGEEFSPKLLSAAYNPYGATNVEGIYQLDLPDRATIRIRPGRYRCTLLVNGYSGRTDQKLIVEDEVLWEPHRSVLPILIVKGVSEVRLGGSTHPVNESATASPTINMNLNPPGSSGEGTPYAGATNSTSIDVYPSELNGLVYVMGTGTNVYLEKQLVVNGTVIADGDIITADTTGFILNSTLVTNPPVGFAKGDQVTPAAGSWRWDTSPVP